MTGAVERLLSEMGATRDQYVRAVEVVDVIDGDTFRCVVDLGFYVHVRMSCRLAGLNAPEHDEPGGPEAKAELERVLTGVRAGVSLPDARGPVVTVQSVRADKFAGRFDAQVIADGVHVNERMIAMGFAVPWTGRGPRPQVPWPPWRAGTP